MSVNSVNGWDLRLVALAETTFGTQATVSSTSAFAAGALEVISASLGPNELGVIRPKADRTLGRGMTGGFIEGRQGAIPFTVESSIKSRAAADTVPQLSALFKAGGLVQTVNSSTSVVYTLAQTPIESGDFVPVSLWRFLGSGAAAFEGEVLRGGTVKSIALSGGDKEVHAKFDGVGVAKRQLGSLDSITVADNSTTSVTITAEESYRVGLGYYLWESEIVNVTACTAGGTSMTITRGALSSTAAAHSSKPMYPYTPQSISFTGTPISEANTSVSIGGATMRVLSWTMNLTTGLDLLPGETGSRYAQGAKSGRYDVKYDIKCVLSGDKVSLLGRSINKVNTAISLTQGTGTGGVINLASSYCEINPITVPDTANDIAIVDLKIRVRESTSLNDMLTITLT